MTSMTAEERAELVAAMSNQTQMGRLNAGEITACFDRLVEMGYDIVKRPVEETVPEPPVVEDPMLHPAKPVHMTASERKAAKSK
jgi:hypothetical protein